MISRIVSLLKVKKISISIARTLLYPHFCLFSKPSACIISFLFYRHPQAALPWNQTPGLSCPNSQERSNEKPAVLPQLILRTTLRLVLLSKARCLRKTCDLLAVKELWSLIPDHSALLLSADTTSLCSPGLYLCIWILCHLLIHPTLSSLTGLLWQNLWALEIPLGKLL